MQISLKGTLLAIGGALLAFALFALKFIGMGRKLEKADAIKAQQDVEHETQEAVDNEHQRTQQEIAESHTAHDSGDFSDFNDDKL